MKLFSVDYKQGRGNQPVKRKWFGAEKDAKAFANDPASDFEVSLSGKVRDVTGPYTHEANGKDGVLSLLNAYA